MDEQLLKELQTLKETLRFVQQRVSDLERRAMGISPAPALTPAPRFVPRPPPVVAKPAPPKPVPTETLETRIGRDWLNKIGITSLVLGVAFFILYTFQYLGPVMKIAMGYAVAGGLIGLGVWLERRDLLRWYARGVIGGGWALLYFVTYAMHHLPAVRVLQSAGLDLLLLAAVAAGAVRHSLKYRSENITALALLLGFITTSISGITAFTLASSALLVAALAWIVARMRWHGLYLYGVVASYATYLFWIGPQVEGFWLKAGFVGLYWAAYSGVLFALEQRDLQRRNALLTATLANGLLFVLTALSEMNSLYPDARYLLLLAVGAAYVLSGPLAKRRALPAIADAHLLLGLSLITLAIPLKLTGRWTGFLWTAEVPFFVWLGLRHDRWSYRLFAMGLAAIVLGRLLFLDLPSGAEISILSWFIPWRVLIGGVGIASFGLAAAAYRLPRHRQALRPAESQAFHLYAAGAFVLLTVLLGLEVSWQWLSVAWAMEGLALVAAGFALRDKVFRVAGLCVFGLLVLKILFVDLSGAETIYRILSFIVAGVILLLASFAYTRWNVRGTKS